MGGVVRIASNKPGTLSSPSLRTVWAVTPFSRAFRAASSSARAFTSHITTAQPGQRFPTLTPTATPTVVPTPTLTTTLAPTATAAGGAQGIGVQLTPTPSASPLPTETAVAFPTEKNKGFSGTGLIVALAVLLVAVLGGSAWIYLYSYLVYVGKMK